jgi:hypothetical protein
MISVKTQNNRFRSILVVLVSVCMATASCLAAEIDSVTTRGIYLENSRAIINQIINQRIKEGVTNANKTSSIKQIVGDLEVFKRKEYCDEDTLYKELRKAIFNSNTVAWGLKGYDVDMQLRDLLRETSYALSLNDSIYRDINYIEGISLNLKELSDLVNIQGYLIGLDKIGHYFAEGWHYFEMTALNDKSIYEALAWGRKKEAGLFGYTTTGVFSYADLVANFNGMRFWNKILLKRDDPIKGRIANLLNRSYVSCSIQIISSLKAGEIVKAWEVNAKFDISDYIDGSWDEGNNCNSYEDPVIEEKVTKRIYKVDPNFSCPCQPEECSLARNKYDEYSRFLLHPRCLRDQEL